MNPASPPRAALPRGMYVLAGFYFLVAIASTGFAWMQVADARAQAELQPAVFGDKLPQGKTVMPNGEVYERDGNLVTLKPKDGGESRGWYVGDDPRAAGGTIGRGPGRVSQEYLIGVGVAVAGCCAIGACCLVRRPWAWRFVYAMQMLVGIFGGVCALFWFVVLLWLASAGGMARDIGLILAPAAIGLELVVVFAALIAFWYLQRSHVRAAFGMEDVKRAEAGLLT